MTGIGVLFLLVCFACLQDLRTGKISNVLVILVMTTGVCSGIWHNGGRGALEYGVRFGVYLMAAYTLYRLGAVGAGDVKLLAAIQGFWGWSSGLTCLGWMCLAAGLLALGKMFTGDYGREKVRYFLSYVGEVAVSGRWRIYLEDMESARNRSGTLHLSVPMMAGLGIFLLRYR